MTDNEIEAPGWHAIDRALATLYPGQEPLHWGTVLSARLGGPDPLDGISAYRSESGAPHWHFVSYGMSELYGKEWNDPEYSGFGFEFTLRVARQGDAPPMWALNFLQNMARYVVGSGNLFEPGHYMNLNGPIALEREDSLIRAVLIAADPLLPAIDTPNGKVQFLQFVGATLDELNAARAWNTTGMLDVMRESNPLFVNDIDRGSILMDVPTAQRIAQRTQADGSSTSALLCGSLKWQLPAPGALVITIGANSVADFRSILPGRLPLGRDFFLAAEGRAVTFKLADRVHWTATSEAELTLSLPADVARALAAAVNPKRGDYVVTSAPDLTIRVVPSVIKDSSGNVVLVVGE